MPNIINLIGKFRFGGTPNNIVLVALICLSGFYWGNDYLNRQYNLLLANSGPRENSQYRTQYQIKQLLAEPIFGSIQTNRSNPSPAPVSTLNLKLTGIISGDQSGIALISVNNQPQAPFFIGDIVIANAVLKSVLNDHVILVRNGVEESLYLDTESGPKNATRQLIASTANSQSINSTNEARKLSKKISKIDDNSYELPKKTLEANLTNPAVLQQALIEPNTGGGFIVKSVQPNGIFAKLGLKPGDVIRSVNQMEVNNMVDVMQLYRLSKDMNKVSNISVEIDRDGNRQELNYNLR